MDIFDYRGTENAMFGLGFNELLIILIIIMIVFGAGKLPEIGSGLGKGIKNFKRAIGGSDEIDITPKKNTDEEKKGNEERKVS